MEIQTQQKRKSSDKVRYFEDTTLGRAQAVKQQTLKFIPVEVWLIENDLQPAVASIGNRFTHEIPTNAIEKQPFVSHMKDTFQAMDIKTSIQKFEQIDFAKSVQR